MSVNKMGDSHSVSAKIVSIKRRAYKPSELRFLEDMS